jgi:carbonic anhydrase
MSNQQLTRQVAAAGSGIGRATALELPGRDQPNMANINSALERNRDFAAAGGHEGAVVFPKLRLFVVTCLDPRVDPAHFLGLALSDAIVVRNVGGRVTPEVINDVAFIAQITENVLPDGPLFEVAVIHHNQCGTGALADDTFRRYYAGRIGADEADLRDHAVLDPAATVTRDVERLPRQQRRLAGRRPWGGVAWIAREHEAVDHEAVLFRLEQLRQLHLRRGSVRTGAIEGVVLRNRSARRQRPP